MAALIPKGTRNGVRADLGPLVIVGSELKDGREEIFVRFVCDGLALGLAFKRAGFTSSDHSAPSKLWALARVQERANAILEARRTQGAVSLSEVTGMLQQVYAGANSEGEYSAAHNAAFSLARLYGHVTDRATLEVVRRPSRDPDAPSEQALGDWVASLPVIGASGPEPSPQIGEQGQISALRGAPASPLGPEPEARDQGPEPSGPEPYMHVDVMNVDVHKKKPNDFNDLAMHVDVHTPGRPESGAPVPAVTGAPHSGAHSEVLDWGPGLQKGAPLQNRQVPGTTGGIPSYEDLFG